MVQFSEKKDDNIFGLQFFVVMFSLMSITARIYGATSECFYFASYEVVVQFKEGKKCTFHKIGNILRGFN